MREMWDYEKSGTFFWVKPRMFSEVVPEKSKNIQSMPQN